VESVVKRAYDVDILKKGLVEIYMGNGKGESMAALSIALHTTG